MNETKKKLEVELNRMVERMRHMGGTATSVETIGPIGDTIQMNQHWSRRQRGDREK